MNGMGLRLFFGRGLLAAAFGLAFGWLGVSEARGENCAVCDKPPGDYLYLIPDKMEPGKKTVCETCAKTLERCYLCGLPAGKGNKELEDGRVLCARDIKLAVLDAEEARQICEELKVSLDRVSRDLSPFPTSTARS